MLLISQIHHISLKICRTIEVDSYVQLLNNYEYAGLLRIRIQRITSGLAIEVTVTDQEVLAYEELGCEKEEKITLSKFAGCVS